MDALMARLVQTERASIDRYSTAVPKATAPLAGTRTIGKAPTLTGESEDWVEWSFQFAAYMIRESQVDEALRWAATEAKQSFEQSSAVSCFDTVVQRKCPGDSEEH